MSADWLRTYYANQLDLHNANQSRGITKRFLWTSKDSNIRILGDELLAKSYVIERKRAGEKISLRQARKALKQLEIDIKRDRDAAKRLKDNTEAKANLKKFIWESEDPKVIELREEALMVAKLIKDNY